MRRILLFFVLLLATHAAQAFAEPDFHDPVAVAKSLSGSQHDEFLKVDAAYRAAVASAPDDFTLASAHCRFIQLGGAGDEEDEEDDGRSDEIESSYKACRSALESRWPDRPEMRLEHFESTFGANALGPGKQLWYASASWPAALRARLASRMHLLCLRSCQPGETALWAVRAATLDGKTLVPEAIVELVKRGDTAGALALSRRADTSNNWNISRNLDALLALPNKSVARAEMDRLSAAGAKIQPMTRVRVDLANGNVVAANRAALGTKFNAYFESERQTRFDLALANGSPAQAARYVRLRDSEPTVSPQRYSVLVRRYPLAMFIPVLMPTTVHVLGSLLFLLLASGVWLLPAHHRGLVLRLRNLQPPPPFERVGLRHAWIAGSIFIVVPMGVAWWLQPELFGAQFAGIGKEELAARFDLFAISTLVCLVLVAPFWRLLGREHVLGTLAGAKQSIPPLLGSCAILIVVVAFTSQSHCGCQPTAIHGGITLIRDGLARYGLGITLLVIAVLVPILEELVFRGLLLGGMSRHIGYGWANLVQASLFALAHDDMPRILVYFTIGILNGRLVSRSKTLWPAIVLHGLNNLVVTLLFAQTMR